MGNVPLTASETIARHPPKLSRTLTLERMAILYARIALGAAFLSAVADRFGLWGKYASWGNFANFTHYTAQVNSFMPAFIIPFLAWAATATELLLGIGLVVGIWPRRVAFGAATLLFLFGTAMAISFGIKSPLDYSVFSASAAALLLALHQSHKSGANS
jgi:putative oxidoreductase